MQDNESQIHCRLVQMNKPSWFLVTNRKFMCILFFKTDILMQLTTEIIIIK